MRRNITATYINLETSSYCLCYPTVRCLYLEYFLLMTYFHAPTYFLSIYHQGFVCFLLCFTSVHYLLYIFLQWKSMFFHMYPNGSHIRNCIKFCRKAKKIFTITQKTIQNIQLDDKALDICCLNSCVRR